MNGLELAERYFFGVGLPALREEFGPYVGRLAAGLVGDGSECFGYDDELSRDHDWGPGFCVWLTAEDFETAGARMQVLLDRLPGSFDGFPPRQTSAWGEGRVGVFEISSFYRGFIGLDRLPVELDEWLMLPESALAACTNGRVFLDGPGEFSRWRSRLLAFYPEDVRRKKIAARTMTAGQAGQYNFPRCSRRGELFAARYAEVKFCADAISMAFLLERRYAPFYKWMHRTVKGLQVLGDWLHQKIDCLVRETDASRKEAVIEEVSAGLIQELQRQGLSECTSSFLPDHGPAIQRTIEDPGLRERNVWVG